jgi:hypothetical protein
MVSQSGIITEGASTLARLPLSLLCKPVCEAGSDRSWAVSAVIVAARDHDLYNAVASGGLLTASSIFAIIFVILSLGCLAFLSSVKWGVIGFPYSSCDTQGH